MTIVPLKFAKKKKDQNDIIGSNIYNILQILYIKYIL